MGSFIRGGASGCACDYVAYKRFAFKKRRMKP